MSEQPKRVLTADQKLAAFFRSQGVPRASRDELAKQLTVGDRKAILAAVSDSGVVSRPAVDAYEKALDEHRVRVREAATKLAAAGDVVIPPKPAEAPAEKPAK